MEENLQLEEIQRSNQQTGDEIPHDPSASATNPEGYTLVPDVIQETPVEEVDPNSVGEVEVTNPQQEGTTNGGILGSSGDIIVGDDSGDDEPEVLNTIPLSPINDVSLDSLSNEETINPVLEDPQDPEDPEEPPAEPPVDPEEPPAEPPVDPEDPEEPPAEPPVDPEEPEEPPVDPEEPEEPPVDPEEPPVDPENPTGSNPGNDKEVGNSPWDGETGASDQPGRGNHQDGEDPEINQPPGDSKNDGGQNSNPENDNGNGRGGGNDFERGQNNGWGNGDDDAPGNSGPHNNAENDETPNANAGELVDRFLENHSFNDEYDNRGGRPEFEYDTYEPEDIGDINVPDVPEPLIDFEIPDYSVDSFDSFDFTD